MTAIVQSINTTAVLTYRNKEYVQATFVNGKGTTWVDSTTQVGEEFIDPMLIPVEVNIGLCTHILYVTIKKYPITLEDLIEE